MADAEFHSNRLEVLAALEQARRRALEVVGGKIESRAKELVAPLGPKGGAMNTDITAQVRNSIAHRAEGKSVVVGSNLDMAAYIELGTGREYQPPPDWIQNTVQRGSHSGLDHWIFYDEKAGEFKVGLPMKPTPFLRPAIENHRDEYKAVLDHEMRNA